LKEIRKDILLNEVLPFGWRINYLANYYSLIANRKLKDRFKTTRQEFVVLFCLANSTNVTATDVCEVCGRPKNTISRAVNSLIAKGYITSSPHPKDARAEILTLEPAGKHLYNRIIVVFTDRDRAMMARLSEAECRTLKQLLDKVIEGFNPWSEEA